MLLLATGRLLSVVLAACLGVVGCGGGTATFTSESQQSGGVAVSTEAAASRTYRDAQTREGEEKPVDAKRMILYSATLEVVVKDLDPAMAEVAKLVTQNKGYIAASEVRGNTGSVRSATYTLRVPVEQFQSLKTALLALGVAERDMLKSDDVTEEFFDLQGRLKSFRSSQERLLELKKQATVKEILEIEPQLEKVNEKIEQIEGRLKYLTTFAALSTINLTMREVKDYKPPTAPTFGGRIGEAFYNSWDGLVSFGKGLVLFVVVIAVWLPVIIPCIMLGMWLLRRMFRTPAKTPPPAPGPLVP